MREFRDGEMVRSTTGEFSGVGIVLAPNRVDFPPHNGPGWPYAVIYIDENREQRMGKSNEGQLKRFKESP